MNVGDRVSVRGEDYIVLHIGPASTMPKFFGKRFFRLSRVRDHSQWSAYGKTVAGNSKLTPADSGI